MSPSLFGSRRAARRSGIHFKELGPPIRSAGRGVLIPEPECDSDCKKCSKRAKRLFVHQSTNDTVDDRQAEDIDKSRVTDVPMTAASASESLSSDDGNRKGNGPAVNNDGSFFPLSSSTLTAGMTSGSLNAPSHYTEGRPSIQSALLESAQTTESGGSASQVSAVEAPRVQTEEK